MRHWINIGRRPMPTILKRSTASIMEFRGDKVARETQYFANPFVAPAFRAQWVERMDT
jgi:hypothetical protein